MTPATASGRTQHRDMRGWIGHDLSKGRRHAAERVKEKIENRAETVLDIVAENPEEKHVRDDMQKPAVHELR